MERIPFPWEARHDGFPVELDEARAFIAQCAELDLKRSRFGVSPAMQPVLQRLLTCRAIVANAEGFDFLLCIGGPRDGDWVSIKRGCHTFEAMAPHPGYSRPPLGDAEIAAMTVERVVYTRQHMQGLGASGTTLHMTLLVLHPMTVAEALLRLLWAYRPDMGVR